MTLARSLVLVALSGVLCPSRSDAPSVEETVADVQSAVTVGDRGAALAAIEHLERSSVPSPQSTAELAWLWIQVGDAARAVWHLEQALERFPEEQPLRQALGWAAMMISNPALTIRVASEVPVSSESYLAAQILLGEAQIEIGDLDAGLRRFASSTRRILIGPRLPWRARQTDDWQWPRRDPTPELPVVHSAHRCGAGVIAGAPGCRCVREREFLHRTGAVHVVRFLLLPTGSPDRRR